MTAPIFKGPEIYIMQMARTDRGARRLPTNETVKQLVNRGLLYREELGDDGWAIFRPTDAGTDAMHRHYKGRQ